MKHAWYLNRHERIKKFMDSSVIMQWDNIRKSILILVLGGLYFTIWVIWLVFSFYTPTLKHWINPQHFVFYLNFFILATIFYFVLALITYRFQQHICIRRYMPYFAVAYLGCSMLFAGYSIGISSPATIAGYINLVTVGLVLHERKIIYPTFIPITCLLLLTIMLCSYSIWAYAPIFSTQLNQLSLYENEYWVYSMMFLYIPIFFAGLGLFEILLTQWRNRELLINEISRKDPLTGIENRRSIAQSLQVIESQQIPYAVVLLDLDYFKQINDEYGHESGDLVLIEVARILNDQIDKPLFSIKSRSLNTAKQHLKQSTLNDPLNASDILLSQQLNSVSFEKQVGLKDCVGRYGGEEFILIFIHKSLEYVLKMTEACRQRIAETKLTTEDGRDLRFTASFGVAFADEGMMKEDIIRMADQALYQAKRQGRNRVVSYNSEMELLQQNL